MAKHTDDSSLRCSFCHKRQDQVEKLIASPSEYPRAYICSECIRVSYMMLEDDLADQAPDQPPEVDPGSVRDV
jgi:ATP-dependent Clp protease ATP-binding subunit ClpX